jgi:nifR3 family TIM-barrel protein
VADRAFREICAGFGACYVVAEMASAKAMSLKSEKTAGLLAVSDIERPAAIQLFGDEPETVATAAAMALKYRPDAIDLNMGCPAPKIAGGGSGAALMKNLKLAGEIIGAVATSVAVPVTVKLRKGWDDDNINAVEAAKIAESRGAAAVTVHGRTRCQFYAPPVDLGIIREVKNAVRIPVVGNGDVTGAESAAKMYENTGCDLVMVGRGALGAPWVFREIDAYLTRGERLKPPELDEKMDVMLRHIKLACEYKGEAIAMREARKHVAWYLKGMKGAAELRRRACALEHYEELEGLVGAIL